MYVKIIDAFTNNNKRAQDIYYFANKENFR